MLLLHRQFKHLDFWIKISLQKFILILTLFCFENLEAKKKYLIHRTLNTRTAVKLSQSNFGIKSHTTAGRKITCRVYLKDYYDEDTDESTNLKALLYGFSIETSSTHFNANAIPIEKEEISCDWATVSRYDCNNTGVDFRNEYSSINYKKNIITAYTKLSANEDHIKTVSALEVFLELEFENNHSALNDLIAIRLPGLGTLFPSDFATTIKGINYQIRPAVSNTVLDESAILYQEDGTDPFEILSNEFGATENIKYKIAVPRKIREPILKAVVFDNEETENEFPKLPDYPILPIRFKPRDAKNKHGYDNWEGRDTDAYPTNIAVWLTKKDVEGSSKYFLVTSAITNTDEIKDKIEGAEAFTIYNKGPIFKAKVGDNVLNYYVYKIIPDDGFIHNRVLMKKIGPLGPFPTSYNKELVSEAPILSSINKKFLAKKSVEENQRYLVAWHRGYWTDFPENTLQSINAARDYLPTSDLLELDLARANDIDEKNNTHHYILYHDPFLFRQSSIGPNKSEHQCINPYDQLLVNNELLKFANREKLAEALKERFPNYTDEEYEKWLYIPDQLTFDELTALTIRDRYGCLTDIPIPSFGEAIETAKTKQIAIMIDKGQDDIDNLYWQAIENNYENCVYFKGDPGRQVPKLTLMYGDELFKQIAYTPYTFDSKAQSRKAYEGGDPDTGEYIFLKEFLDKEIEKNWIIPGVELQIKLYVEDGKWGNDHNFSPRGIEKLLAWGEKHKDTKWIGITQINPTSYNGFDNKILYMNAPLLPSQSNAYSSRFDRRADLNFNINYLKCDYWTTDRPDVVIDFLKALGKYTD